MAVSPSLNLALAPLMGELTRLQARIAQLERNQRAAQLGFSSIENGSITFNDANGNPQLVSGLQPDGTYAHAAVTANPPPQPPDQPLAGPGVLSLWTYWDGLMANGTSPLADFDHIEVHCSAVAGFTPNLTTLQGTMTHSGLFGIGSLLAGQTYYVTFVAINAAGNASQPSLYASAVPSSVPASIAPGQITALMLQTGSITAQQIAAEAGILGSQIANNTITAGNIVAGTITAGLLAAGIVVAGIIDGTTINAVTMNAGTLNAPAINGGTITGMTITAGNTIINSQGIFTYSSLPPVAGNLIASNGVTTPGTDSAGNAYLGGDVTYHNTGIGFFLASQLSNGTISFYQATTEAGPWTLAANIGQALVAGQGQLQIATGALISTQGTASNPTQISTDAWHSVTLPSGVTGTIRSKLLSEKNMAVLDVNVTITSTLTTGTSYAGGALPAAAYYPVAAEQLPLAVNQGMGTSPASPRVLIPASSGAIQLNMPGFTTAGLACNVWGTIVYPLD